MDGPTTQNEIAVNRGIITLLGWRVDNVLKIYQTSQQASKLGRISDSPGTPPDTSAGESTKKKYY